MERRDYEKHLMGELCWDCHAATHGSAARQRQCPGCRRKWSYEQRRQQWEILKAFVLGSTAHHTARTLRISYPTVWHHYRSWRRCLWEQSERERPPLCGEIEAGESCFGGRRKGQRGRGAAGKVRVFGLLERGGKVYSVVVPDCTKETLMAKIRDHSAKGSVYYTDTSSAATTTSRATANTSRSTTRSPSKAAGATSTASRGSGASPRTGTVRPTASIPTTSPSTSANTSSASTTAQTTFSISFTTWLSALISHSNLNQLLP